MHFFFWIAEPDFDHDNPTASFLNWNFFPEVLFLVKPMADFKRTSGSIMTFDDVVINVGGGYVANANDINYGKFIAPVAGIYQITATSENLEATQKVGAFLLVNWDYLVRNKADVANDHSGVITLMLRLEAGNQVWLMARDSNHYFNAERTIFSGHLLHAEA